MINHKKQILSIIAVAVAATVSAQAGVVVKAPSNDIGVGPYVALQGGLNVFSSVSDNISSVKFATGKEFFKDKSSVGGFAGLKLGYVFKVDAAVRPAIEYDGYWAQNRVTEDTTAVFSGISDKGSNYVRGTIFANMINGIARFDLGEFQPYLGAGIGVATTSGKGIINDPTGIGSNLPTGGITSSTDLAVQLVAGADYYVTDSTSVFVEYKLLNVVDAYANTVANLRSNLVGLGVRFHF